MEKKQCGVKYGSFDTLSDAQGACDDDWNCQAIADNGCNKDDKGDFSLCPVWFEAQDSSASCVYWKEYGKENSRLSKCLMFK